MKLILFILLFFLSFNSNAQNWCVNYLRPLKTDINDKKEIGLQRWEHTWQNFARRAKAHPDFKYISDLIPRSMTTLERQEILKTAKQYRQKIYNRLLEQGQEVKKAQKLSQTAYARFLMNSFFESKLELKFIDPQLLGSKRSLIRPVNGSFATLDSLGISYKDLKDTFEGVESQWPQLVKKVRPYKGGSMLPVSHPVLIAGGRFREPYYWDTYFGALGLSLTKRYDLVDFQLKNFTDLINTYGKIPNGTRTYYLSRSQPPVVSLLARQVYEDAQNLGGQRYEKTKAWLLKEVYPALKKDYENFWMRERLDAKSGLNFYSDQYNLPRPERHSHDVESKLGETFRDVRAEAESGFDHTNVFQGQASQIATVSLNSFLYAYEKNLSFFASLAGETRKSYQYERAAYLRRQRMNRFMWNSKRGAFQNYHLKREALMEEALSADAFSAMYVGLASPRQSEKMVPELLETLELPGGIGASSLFNSSKQWDGNLGWAPFQVMAVSALDRYGFSMEAQRVAQKWVATNVMTYKREGLFYEKLDLSRMDKPVEDSSKYPTQTGFLWTNGSLIWMLNYLGFGFE